MRKTGLKGCVYDFSADYDAIAGSDLFHEKEWSSIKMFGFIKKYFLTAMMFLGCNLSSVNPLERV